jgi:hypothetical protein
MEKLSTADIHEVLLEVEPTIMGLVTENRDLRTKVAEYERRDRAGVIVDQMVDRKLVPEDGRREKVAELLSDPSRDLDVVEEAVKLDSPVLKLASVGAEDEAGTGMDALTEAILGS